jgi:hypothetical protein
MAERVDHAVLLGDPHGLLGARSKVLSATLGHPVERIYRIPTAKRDGRRQSQEWRAHRAIVCNELIRGIAAMAGSCYLRTVIVVQSG